MTRLLTKVRSSSLAHRYDQIYSIEEIRTNPTLQWVAGALLLSFFVSFWEFSNSNAVTIEAWRANTYTCWSYFQSCGEYYFLSTLPFGYSQSFFYTILFGFLILSVICIAQRRFRLLHALMILLFTWKFLVVFVLSMSEGGNYDYYDLILAAIFLFLPYKIFFLRLGFVLLYFLAATAKIHGGWIVGSYFSALAIGLPLFPQYLTPIVTNVVIFMQIVGVWFLLSPEPMRQRAAFIFFLCFHFYSCILVYYRYVTTALPMLIILFGTLAPRTEVPLTKKSLIGWGFIILLFAWQSIAYLIPYDQKLTQEGNKFGLYMFDANHQCRSTYTITNHDGTTTHAQTESVIARHRCNPYNYWFTLNQICIRDKTISGIAWTFDHSINGGPLYRIVDTADACKLTYKTFLHNDWIAVPETGAAALGNPVKNIYQ